MTDGPDEDAVAKVFDLLGFGPMETRAYRALLDADGVLRAREVAERSDVSRGRIYEVLQHLEDAGFVTSHEETVKQYSAYQPEIAVSAYLQRLEAEVLGRIPDLEDVETTSTDMVGERLRILQSDEEIARLQTRVYDGAKASVQLFEKQTLFPDRGPDEMADESEWYNTKTEALERCDDFRIIVAAAVLDDPNLVDRVESAIELGMPIRIVEGLRVHALVVDERHVVMNLPEAPKVPANPQIYVRHPGLAQLLSRAFDAMWAEAPTYEDYVEEDEDG